MDENQVTPGADENDTEGAVPEAPAAPEGGATPEEGAAM